MTPEELVEKITKYCFCKKYAERVLKIVLSAIKRGEVVEDSRMKCADCKVKTVLTPSFARLAEEK